MARTADSSRTETIYFNLKSQILTGRLLPGHKLNISSLCATCDSSLAAVRESLSRLTSEGLVLSESFKGFRVSPVSISDLKQLMEARIEIERLCLTASLTNGGMEWEGRIVSLLHQLSRFPGDNTLGNVVDEWSGVHAEFHDALAAGCNNIWLLDIRRRLYEQGERYRRLPLVVSAKLPERDTLSEHRLIAQAALDRDVKLVIKLIRDHLFLTTTILLESLAGDDRFVSI